MRTKLLNKAKSSKQNSDSMRKLREENERLHKLILSLTSSHDDEIHSWINSVAAFHDKLEAANKRIVELNKQLSGRQGPQ